MHDRAMQALYLLALDPIAETQAEPNSYGFRLERSPADALAQCHTVLALQQSAQWILEGDIRSCFDGISHDWLMARIPMDKGILQQWLKAGFMDKHVLYPTEAGVPQGGIASPVLMNLTLTGLERPIKGAFPAFQGHTRTNVHGIRCADACIMTGTSPAFLAQAVSPRVAQFLAERGRERSRDTTRITHIGDGFAFLGTPGRT